MFLNGFKMYASTIVDTNHKSATNLLQNCQVSGLGYKSQVVGYQTAEMISPKGKQNLLEVLTRCSDCILTDQEHRANHCHLGADNSRGCRARR